jgi:hypothetical protein
MKGLEPDELEALIADLPGGRYAIFSKTCLRISFSPNTCGSRFHGLIPTLQCSGFDSCWGTLVSFQHPGWKSISAKVTRHGWRIDWTHGCFS